jgi:hypothetical protein
MIPHIARMFQKHMDLLMRHRWKSDSYYYDGANIPPFTNKRVTLQKELWPIYLPSALPA